MVFRRHWLFTALLSVSLVHLQAREAPDGVTVPPPPAAHHATGELTSPHPEATESAHGGTPHHGPEVVVLGQKVGLVGQFLTKLFNFAVFFLLLFFLLKKSLAAAFKQRAHTLENQLAQASREKAENEAKMQAMAVRMGNLERELIEAREKAEKESEWEKERILEGARTEAEQIITQTKQDIALQQRLAEQALRGTIARLAVEGAKLRLAHQVDASLDEKLLDQAIAQIGEAK